MRGRAVDLEPRREAEVRHAVEQAEVDRLGHAALVAVDVAERADVEDLPRGEVVNVLASVNAGAHRFVAREMRHQAQLDLRVVGGEQHAVGRAGDERAPDLTPELAAHRNVLQVRVGRREASGRGRRLVEDRVQAAVARSTSAGNTSM